MSINTNTNINSLQVIPLHNQSSFTKWNRTVHLTLHKQGHTQYITTNYTTIIQAVDDYDAKHTAHLFKSLTITSTISISSGSISGEKSSAAKVKLDNTRKMQIAALIGNTASLKSAQELCKGRCKTFVLICSTIAPELLKDISSMSDGCPLALWKVINNCYGNNDIALQTAWRDLGKPNIYLIHVGDTVHSIWA
jgi:hypothetical protein